MLIWEDRILMKPPLKDPCALSASIDIENWRNVPSSARAGCATVRYLSLFVVCLNYGIINRNHSCTVEMTMKLVENSASLSKKQFSL